MRRLAAVRWPATVVATGCLVGIGLGALLHAVGRSGAGDAVWAAADAVLLVPLSWSVIRTLRRRDVGVDAIALVSMAGALALGEYLARAVIALMLAGGNALEERAGARARRELTALVERAPRIATLLDGDQIRAVPVEEVRVGDLVLVRAGEVLPVDGVVETDQAMVDEAALTGESLPVLCRPGEDADRVCGFSRKPTRRSPLSSCPHERSAALLMPPHRRVATLGI